MTNKMYEITTRDGVHVATTWATSEFEARMEHEALGGHYIVEEYEKAPCDKYWQQGPLTGITQTGGDKS